MDFVMPDVDTELVSLLRQAKKTPMSFVFVAKGTEGKLLLNKKKISAKEANEAKKECGGGTIYQGRCQEQDGTLMFETAKQPPNTLAKQLKTIIKRDAGLTLPVDVRQAEDLEDEEAGSESTEPGKQTEGTIPPPPPPPPLPQEGGAMLKRLNAMSAGIKAALAGPEAARVQTLVSTVNGLIKNKDFVQ